MIPEFVYRPVYDETGRAIEMWPDNKGRGRVKRVQKGWRERLLCAKCEQYLNRHFEQPSVGVWRTFFG